jgi:hypothetical protein
MKNLTLFILMLCGLGAAAQHHWNPASAWPPFQVVMDSVEQHYDFKQGIYHLDRSPEGWGVQVENQEGEQVCRLIIWTPEGGWEFQPWQSGETGAQCIHCGNKAYHENSFRLYPYWAYAGWDQDVIHLLNKRSDLPDTAWYSLARAYANYAQGLIRPQWGFHSPMSDSAARYESISSSRLQSYMAYQDSAISSFRRVEALNPRFETIIGPIAVKTASEYIHTALTLESLKVPGFASAYYADNLYPTLLISSARNYLEACPEDAILFTHGDNDTYPLLYIQMKYGIRQDVTVVNTSLLNTGWYGEMLRDNLISVRNPLTFSTAIDIWYDDVSQYMMVEEDGGVKYEEIQRQLIKMEVGWNPGDLRLGRHILLRRGSGSEFRWTIENDYLLRNELAMLDIMASNPFRPICFSSGSHLSSLAFMEQDLLYGGMIMTLVADVPGISVSGYGRINREHLQGILGRHFDGAGYREALQWDYYEPITGNARMAFGMLAWAQALDGKRAAVDSTVERYRAVFGVEAGSSSDAVIWAMAWYGLGERERAGSLLRPLAELAAIAYQEAQMGGTGQDSKVKGYLDLLDQAIALAGQEEDWALAAYLQQKRNMLR